jgi:hypothetical protein
LDSIEINIPLELSEIGEKLMLILKNELRKENEEHKESSRLMKEFFD